MGGRCSKLTSIVGGGSSLKPMLELKAGEIVPGANFMGKNYIDKYCEHVMEHPEGIDPKRIFIAHCLVDSSAGEIKEKLGKGYGFNNVIITNTSPTTSVHCGPGTLGIFFLNK